MRDELLLKEERNDFWYLIKRRRYKAGFTDYLIVNFPISCVSYVKGELDRKVFDDIVDLAIKYIVIGKKYVVEPVYVYPDIVDKLRLPKATRDGEYFISKFSSFQYYFNKEAEIGSIGYKDNRFHAKDPKIEEFLNTHLSRGTIKINKNARGDKPLKFLIIYPEIGFLDPYISKDGLLFNSHFFLMELVDLESYHSLMGTPFGTLIINNKFILPPLYPRATLFLSEDNGAKIEIFSIKNVDIKIEGKIYREGKNAQIFMRPEYKITPIQRGMDIVIINNRIVSYKYKGNTPIPEGGYVIHIEDEIELSTYKVDYYVDQDVRFAVGAGPALVINGEILNDFSYEFTGRSTPSSYPPEKVFFDWNNKHTSRVAIGIRDDRFILLYASGVNEETYVPAYDSIGFTLREMADTIKEYADNAINLDGGGSAQVYLFGGKPLRFGDRRGFPGLEFQRPIPLGLKLHL